MRLPPPLLVLNHVFDDIQELYQEFDLYSLTHPASVEQFIMNMVIVAALVGIAWVLFKIISQFF